MQNAKWRRASSSSRPSECGARSKGRWRVRGREERGLIGDEIPERLRHLVDAREDLAHRGVPAIGVAMEIAGAHLPAAPRGAAGAAEGDAIDLEHAVVGGELLALGDVAERD